MWLFFIDYNDVLATLLETFFNILCQKTDTHTLTQDHCFTSAGTLGLPSMNFLTGFCKLVQYSPNAWQTYCKFGVH